jgi:hypothetical protein
VQAKERRNTQFKNIVTHNLFVVVRPILEWCELPMGSYEALFLQIQPHLVTNLKLVRNPMMVTSLLILGTALLQDITKLLLEVLDPFNNFCCFVYLNMSVGGICWGRWNGQSYINGGKWLEPQAHLKKAMANGDVEGSIIVI